MPDSYLVTVLGSAAFVSFVIEGLKKASWFPFLNLNTSTLNSWVSILVAILSSIGITYAWNPDTRDLTFHVPTVLALLTAGWHACVQWAFQKGAYHAFVQTPKPVTLEPDITTAKPPAERDAL